MNGEKIQNQNTSNTENSFEQMAKEVGEFDPGRQFVNKWNANWKTRMESCLEKPVDIEKLSETTTEKPLDNPEWRDQLFMPYVCGIYASVAEIGNLVDQCHGLGVNDSIVGAVKLFSNLYGLKQEPTIKVLDPNADKTIKKEFAPFGKYSIKKNPYSPPTYDLEINFEKFSDYSNAVGDRAMATRLVGTIAHELWHAHQDELIRKDPNSPIYGKYVENINNYKASKTGKRNEYFSYIDQIIEDEPSHISRAIEETLKVYDRNKEAFQNNAAACAENKAEVMQLLQKQKQKLAEAGL